MASTNTTGTTGNAGPTQSYADIKDDLRKSGRELSNSTQAKREKVSTEASREARTRAEGVKNFAAEEMEDFSDVAEATAEALDAQHHEKLSSYVSDIAGYVGNMANSLQHKSADDLVHDAKQMAHQNPSLFIAGGIAMGLGIARLAKSGAQRPNSNQSDSIGSQPTSASFNDTDLDGTGASFNDGAYSPASTEPTSKPSTSDPLDSDFYNRNTEYDKI